MTIVDTSVWVDYLDGKDTLQTVWLDRMIPFTPIGLTDLVLCEVLQGYSDKRAFARVQQEMAVYTFFATGDYELAIASALNYAFLRKRGITIRKTIDCLIATFCIAHGHTLLHHDRDFDPSKTTSASKSSIRPATDICPAPSTAHPIPHE